MNNPTTDLIAFTRQYISEANANGNFNLEQRLKTTLNKFIAFLGKEQLAFDALTPQLLRDYRAWLVSCNIVQNTVATYLRILKQIYDVAVNRGVTSNSRPFKGMTLTARAKYEKNGLTLRELQRMRYLDLSADSDSAAFARDLFIFSVCAKGMGCNEMFRLTHDDIRDGRVTYTPLGTKRTVTFRWEPLMQEIVDRYKAPSKEPTTPFIFPVITSTDPEVQWRQCNNAVHVVNANLKKIGKKLGLPFSLTPAIALNTWEKITQDVSIGGMLM